MGADLPQEFQRNMMMSIGGLPQNFINNIKKGPYTPEFLSNLQRSLRDVKIQPSKREEIMLQNLQQQNDEKTGKKGKKN